MTLQYLLKTGAFPVKNEPRADTDVCSSCGGRHSKDQSVSIHLGLVVSLLCLNLLFFFTGVLANVGGEDVCAWVAAALHYALLMSLTWMAIEVFHTFWLVYMVFSPNPKPYLRNLVGYGKSVT